MKGFAVTCKISLTRQDTKKRNVIKENYDVSILEGIDQGQIRSWTLGAIIQNWTLGGISALFM